MAQSSGTPHIDIFKNLIENPPHREEKKIDLMYYASLIWRRRWIIITIFCMAMISGIYLAITLPKTYEAGTLILVEPQRVPNSYVQSIISADLDLRLNNITQIVKSRTSLMGIIDKFNLFSEVKYKDMFIEDKIKKMRELISVELNTNNRRKGTNYFTISFKGKDPNKVMNVVNDITALVINQNLKVRESQAESTTEFLNDQLTKMRKDLETVEKALGNYRKKHMGELPEQLNANLRMIDNLQRQLIEKQASLRNEKDRLVSIGNQLRLARDQSKLINTLQLGTKDPQSLESLKNQLVDLKSRYTDKHPEVIKLKNKIVEMKKENKSGIPTIENEFKLQREDINKEIKNMEKEISDIKTRIAFYQSRVENTPKREQELLSLKRNYKNIQETYNSLLKRKLEANIATSMEKKQKGEKFRIIDPARLPEKPVSPDMNKFFIICLAIGLSLSGGLVFLMDYFDNSVKKPELIEDKFGIPVLAVMPTIRHHKDIIWQRINILFSVFGGVVSLILLACFTAVTILDMHQIVNLIKKFTFI
jgi:polysaccharide chain length determinant protein (PEP-CTERM system associated)